ncbi:MAG TPA: methionine synthase, partial [Acidimicrobiaceae bacterium]|nr:methionine synthase [Acidimicrobiaceae bacterium]
MVDLRERIATNGPLVLDGAMGTQLFAAGLTAGDPPEVWNVDHPDRIRAIHRSYLEAGSDVVLTNSFGGNRRRLKLHNLQDRVHELNAAAASN